MEPYTRLFEKTLAAKEADSKVPVTCALLNFYETQQSLLASAQTRKQKFEEKNRKVETASLKYREGLQQKIDMEQRRHEKNRQDKLKKLVQNEQHKYKYVQEVNLKFKEGQKTHFRDRLQQFKEFDDEMTRYWSETKIKKERAFATQSAAKPLYQNAVQRKKILEQRNNQLGLNVKADLLKKLSGREQLINRQVQQKKEEVHQFHNEQLESNREKHQQIVQARQNQFINSIGSHFEVSSELLTKNKKQFERKLKDKQYDQLVKKETIRGTFLQKTRNKSASLADCKCKRINNVEEGITKSVVFMEKNRHSLFTQTLNNHQKNPSALWTSRKDFLTRNQSLRSTVDCNKEMLRERKQFLDTDNLKKENEIADSIRLKKQIEVQGNCYVRLLNVK